MAILITLLPTTWPDHSPATPTSSPTSDSLEAAVIIFQGFDFSTRMCRANFKLKEACERIWYQSHSLSLFPSLRLRLSIYPSICLTVSPSIYLNHCESVSAHGSAWLPSLITWVQPQLSCPVPRPRIVALLEPLEERVALGLAPLPDFAPAWRGEASPI